MKDSWQGARADGAVIAWNTAGLGMLAGRDDAVLPDIRGWPGQQGSGTGSALFRAAADRTGARGCRWLKIETQNVNAAACRFYYKTTTAPAPEREASPGRPGRPKAHRDDRNRGVSCG